MAGKSNDPQTQERVLAVRSVLEALNGPWHKRAMQVFLVIVLAHWAEHILQAYQVYVMGWPRGHSHGGLGLFFPWLVKSELLHYGYALVMLVGLALLRPAFVGLARRWWNVALAIQIWHHLEHALLFGQALTGDNLFGSPVPISLLQVVVPRVELHLFYNAAVFVPMVMGMLYHIYPKRGEALSLGCNCYTSKRANTESL